MSEFNISIESGTSKRLPVGNKWSEKDIIVTATGGSEDLNDVLTEQEALIDELKEVLRGKAAGGGVNLEETSIFDPTKETILTRSTATYKDIILAKTMIAYINTGKYAGYIGCKFDATVGETYRVSWDKISSSEDFVFYYESDTILTKVDDHYGTRIQHSNNPFIITATKPYVYIWVAHPSVPSTDLVLVTGLMVHKASEVN